MDTELLSNVVNYLNNESNYKWATSETLINKLQLTQLSPIELDSKLARIYQNTEDPGIRFSTLPSAKSLDVLWGSIERIGNRNVIDIYRTDGPNENEREKKSKDFNMFLSYSFKDSEYVIELSRKLAEYNVFAWIAEIEILKNEHINQAVRNSIEALPLFGAYLSQNILRSTWSAKEIDFAFHNKNEIIGFVDTNDEWLINSIISNRFYNGSKVRDEIFNQVFDNNPNVKVLLFPDNYGKLNQRLKESVSIIDWEYLINLKQ